MGTQSDTKRLRELSLFSGAGGGLLGSLLLGWRTVCCVEWNDYCQRVLAQRMQDGWLDECPIWDDVRTFDGRPWRGRVDVLTAGFPCQPFSAAGKRRAGNDSRNMWPDTARLIREVRPPVAFLENVAGLTSGKHGYFGRILGDLAEIGYDVVWDVVPAAAVDAPHERERVWILACDAHANGEPKRIINAQTRRMQEFSGQIRRWSDKPESVGMDDGVGERLDFKRKISHADQAPMEGGRLSIGTPTKHAIDGRYRRWQAEPDVDRVADGLAHRVDRLKALGNGQVPQQMALAWSLLSRRMARALD